MAILKRYLFLVAAMALTAVFTYLIVANRFRREQVQSLRAELARVAAERADLERELEMTRTDRTPRRRPDSPALPPGVVLLRETSAPPAQVESAAPSNPWTGPAAAEVPPSRSSLVAAAAGVGPVLVPSWVRFVGTTNSSCRIHGTASRQAWALQSSVIGGFVDLDPRLSPAWPAATAAQWLGNNLAAQAEATVPVWSLRPDPRVGRALLDEQAVRASLSEGTHPKIEYRLHDLVLIPGANHAAGIIPCQSRGLLAVAGVTNLIEMPVTLNLQRAPRLVVSGNTTLRMTAFGIQPPEARGPDGPVQMGDEVTVAFEWVLAQVPNPPAIRERRRVP